MLDRPDVTVVIPTRNRWRFLQRSVASALRQEDVAVEVVVVDDGSSDETPASLAKFADPRLLIVRLETSRGVSVARNTGLSRARAEWVAFLDDDDIWAPTKLRRQLDAAGAVGARWSYSGVVTVDEQLDPVLPTDPPVPPERVRDEVLSANVLTTGSNIAAQRDAIEDLGGFDEGLAVLDDWDMCIRLAHAFPAAAVYEPLVAYVRHAATHHVMSGDLVVKDLRRLRRKHLAEGRRVDCVAVSRWAAAGHRYGGRRAMAARLYLRTGLEFRSLGNVLRGLLVPFTRVKPPSAADTRETRPSWLDPYVATSP